MEGAGPAERNERVVPRVVPPLHRHAPKGPLHRRVGDPQDAEGGLLRRSAQRFAEAPHCAAGGLRGHVEGIGAAEHAVGVEAAEREVRVGDRRPGAAAPVADGPRLGPRALRAHPQAAAGVDVGDAAAPGPDGVNVGGGEAKREAGDRMLGGAGHRPVAEGHVGARAAHVEGHHARRLAQGAPGHPEGADHPAGRAAQGETGGLLAGGPRPNRAAARLHDANRPLAQFAAETRQVALHPGADVRVGDRRGHALVLPVLRQEGAASGHRDLLGQLVSKELGGPLLVLGVSVGKEKREGDALDVLFLENAGHAAHGRLVQRGEDVPLGTDALRHFVAPGGRHEGIRPRRRQVVEVGPVLPPDGEHVGEALRGHQRRRCAPPLQKRICRRRGAVGDGRRGGHVEPTEPRADGLVLGIGGGDLAHLQARPGRHDEVGERAADVDPHLRRAVCIGGAGSRHRGCRNDAVAWGCPKDGGAPTQSPAVRRRACGCACGISCVPGRSMSTSKKPHGVVTIVVTT